MKRFILVSFAFLGWCFWELSGGADFEPSAVAKPIFAPAAPLEEPPRFANEGTLQLEPSLPLAAAEETQTAPVGGSNIETASRQVVTASLENTASRVDTVAATAPDAEALQSQTDLLVQAVLSADQPADQPDGTEIAIDQSRLAAALDTRPVINISPEGLSASGLGSGFLESDTQTQPTQVVGALTGQAITFSSLNAAQSNDRPDLREVTGDLVNMRAGPGTDFSVLDRLSQGDAVEVLETGADGWLKLRVVATGQEGYMADWLVTARVQ